MTLENNKDGAPELHKSSSTSIDAVTENFTNMAVVDDDNTTTLSICANCGKEGNSDNSLKFCGACKLVKYCSAPCQKAHRPMHKRECKQRAAQLYDEKLFQEPPPPEECPICMLPLPLDTRDSIFKICCGKVICSGCIYAMSMSEGKDLCAFCRTPPASSDDEHIQRTEKLMHKGNAVAFVMLAGYHSIGRRGLPQDDLKANELWLKAGELGCSAAYYNLGNSYEQGRGVAIDMKKAKHYMELAAMGGYVVARHNLGCVEMEAGNHKRAMKHFIIAAKAGYDRPLDVVKEGYMYGDISKDEYASTLRAYQKSRNEMKSDMREKAEVRLDVK